MIKNLHHTGVIVSNRERSIEFYRDILGMELVRTEERVLHQHNGLGNSGITETRQRLALLQSGNSLFELIEYETPQGRTFDRHYNDIGTMHIALQVVDIDSVYQSLQAKGIPFTAPPATLSTGPAKGYRWANCLDPDGVAVQLVQPA